MENKESPNLLKTFFIRRACRILPLYVLSLVIFCIGITTLNSNVLPAKLQLPFLNHGPVWPYATFTQNYWMAITGSWGATFNNVTWSLAIEEHFYLVVPFIVLAVNRKIFPCVMAFALIFTVLFRCATYGQEFNEKLFLMTHSRLDGLCLGVLLAWLLRQPGAWEKIRSRRGSIYLAGAALTGLIGWIMVIKPNNVSDLMSMYGYLALAVFYTVILLIAITFNNSIFSACLRISPLRFIGKISFCVYLIHQPVKMITYAYVLNKLPAIEKSSDILAPALSFVFTILLAWASYALFESRFIAIGHRHTFDSGGNPADSAQKNSPV